MTAQGIITLIAITAPFWGAVLFMVLGYLSFSVLCRRFRLRKTAMASVLLLGAILLVSIIYILIALAQLARQIHICENIKPQVTLFDYSQNIAKLRYIPKVRSVYVLSLDVPSLQQSLDLVTQNNPFIYREINYSVNGKRFVVPKEKFRSGFISKQHNTTEFARVYLSAGKPYDIVVILPTTAPSTLEKYHVGLLIAPEKPAGLGYEDIGYLIFYVWPIPIIIDLIAVIILLLLFIRIVKYKH